MGRRRCERRALIPFIIIVMIIVVVWLELGQPASGLVYNAMILVSVKLNRDFYDATSYRTQRVRGAATEGVVEACCVALQFLRGTIFSCGAEEG